MTDKHEFGGMWTKTKLLALKDYLEFYTMALKGTPFQLMYIDAFAGTGRITIEDMGQEDPESHEFLNGSARNALELKHPFDRYVFIERASKHVSALNELKDEYPDANIHICQGDANQEIRRIAMETDWRSWRAVVFLDPYGAQVEWETLEQLARTKCVDVWLLVPFGIAYNRMLPNSADVPDGWAKRLSAAFGTDEWKEAAYEEVTVTLDMFERTDTELRRRKLEDIEQWFEERLNGLFPRVSAPIYLKNANGSWLYSLYFAVANPNPKAQGLAFKVADYIIKKFGDKRGTK